MASLERRESSLEEIPAPSSDWDTGNTPETSTRHRRRGKFPIEDIPSIVQGRYVTPKGSIRTALEPTSESSLTQWLMKWLNKMGHGHRDYSLFLFHKKGSFRKNVKKVVKSRIFKFLMAVVVIINALTLCFYSPSVRSDKKEVNSHFALGSIVFILAYMVEAGLMIIAYGLILHPKSYLRTVTHVLDVFVIVFGILYVSLNTSHHTVSEVFAALMAIKLIRILAIFDSVTFILKALARSLVPLFFLSLLTLCVMVFFSLVGLELFLGRLHGACFSDFVSPTGPSSFRVSDFPCYFDQEAPETVPSYVRGDHECNRSTCSFWEEGPNSGITSFDNFGLSMLTVFQLISLEGWSGVFYLYESALGYAFAWVYFVLVIFLGSVFILNLWLGVLTSVFIGVSDRQETHGNIRRLKENKRIEEDLRNYRDWMDKAVPPDLPSEIGSIGRRPSLPINVVWRRHSLEGDESEEEGLELEEWVPEGREGGVSREAIKKERWVWLVQRSRLWAFKLLRSRWFYWSILGLHLVNLLLLMTIHYPSPSSLDKTIFILNYIFTGVYILEFLLQMYVKGPRKYFASSPIFHTAVFILILLNILDILILMHIPAITINLFSISIYVNAIYSFRLVTVFKHTRYWKAIKEIINTVIQVFTLILSLVTLMGIFLFVFTILGLRLFGDRLSVTENVTPNFDNFFNSFLLVFQLLTTEDWNNVLYTSLDSFESSSEIIFPVIYFVLAIILGPFILVSIFLAIAVDKLSEARSLEEDSAQQSEKMEEMRKVRKEQLQALRHPEESHAHRRTLKRAIQFYTSNPQQRTKPGQGQQPRKSLWHQFSTPVERVLQRGGTLVRRTDPSRHYRRSASEPSPVEPPPDLRSVSEAATSVPQEAGQTRTPPPRTNPLRLVKRTSNYFDWQKTRLGGGVSEPQTRQETKKNTPSAVRSSPTEDDSVFIFPDHNPPPSPLHHQDSVLSSPDRWTAKTTDSLMSFERTQSFPTRSAISSGQSSSLERLTSTQLDPISEGEGEGEGEDGTSLPEGQSEGEEVQRTSPPAPLLSPSWLPQPTLSEDFQQRLGRESSLEAIQMHGSEEQRRSKQKRCCAGGFHPKAKFLKMYSWLKDYLGTIQFNPKEELEEIPNHSAFFILSPDNRFREFCYKLVCSKTFQIITYSTVFLSSILLTLELPITEGISESLCLVQDTLVYIDLLFICYFLVEMILKMTALGVFLHRGSYFRGFFNTIDFIVTITSLIPLIVYFVNLNRGETTRQECLSYSYNSRLVPVALSSLRVIRVLRPFRVFRISGLYGVVTGLLSSLKSIGSIFLIDLLVLTIFAVMGTTIFRGRFFFCTDPLMTTEEECRGSFFVYPSADLSCPKVEKRVWVQNGLNFDNVGSSLLTLFAMLTAEGWQNVMYNGINSVRLQDNVPQGPSLNNSPVSFLYFIIYMLIMTFVLVNLFVGFVIVTFQEVGVKAFRETKLDRNQRNCLYYALTARPYLHYSPKFNIHQKLLELVTHRFTKMIIFIALLLNVVVLAMQREGNSREWIKVIYWINFVFTVFFAMETTLKIIAFTPAYYFRHGWNTFECLVTLASLLEIIIQQSLQPPDFEYTHIASAYRVLRLLHFIPQVRLILWTVLKSLEIFPWVGVLLVVVIFSYAVVGMQVFGTIRLASIDEVDQTEITVYNNFGNFPQALLVMIRVATGENWPDVMLSCREGRPCNNGTTVGSGSCGSDFTYFFFPSFFFISAILILNLFVAIIIDNFDYLVRDRSILGAHQLGAFVNLWSLYDSQAKGTLPPNDVMNLLRRCNPPVGWGKLCPHTLAYKKMMKLNMPLLEGRVTFNATMFALVRTALKIHCEGCVNCVRVCNQDLKKKLEKLFPAIPHKKLEEVLPDSMAHTVRQEYAALLIQQHWRNYTLRRKKTIQRFQGSQRRRLKAGLRRLPELGPDLRERKISDFDFLSPLHQRRPSGASSIGTTSVTLESPFLFPDPAASQRVLEHVEEEAALPETRGRGSVRQRVHLPETIPEVPEGASTEGVESGLIERRLRRPLSEVSLQSDLSFASAFSTPIAGSLASIPSVSRDGEEAGERGREREDSFSYHPMETMV